MHVQLFTGSVLYSRLHATVIQQLTRFITRQIFESRGFSAGKFLTLRQNMQKAPQLVSKEASPQNAVETPAAMETGKDGNVADSLSEFLVAAYYEEESGVETLQAKEVEDLTSLLRAPHSVKRPHAPVSRNNSRDKFDKVSKAPSPTPKKILRHGGKLVVTLYHCCDNTVSRTVSHYLLFWENFEWGSTDAAVDKFVVSSRANHLTVSILTIHWNALSQISYINWF